MMLCVNIRAVSFVFPSYAFSRLSADGDPIQENKSCVLDRHGSIDNFFSKALDFKYYSANNADIDLYLCTC